MTRVELFGWTLELQVPIAMHVLILFIQAVLQHGWSYLGRSNHGLLIPGAVPDMSRPRLFGIQYGFRYMKYEDYEPSISGSEQECSWNGISPYRVARLAVSMAYDSTRLRTA